MEIPPRARRRDLWRGSTVGRDGNTSACAEKRLVFAGTKTHRGKYLRVRGEEASSTPPKTATTEIPPRARRRANSGQNALNGKGNTSACAEKRHRKRWLGSFRWKYLRVRGEEFAIIASEVAVSEIPPRARRRVRHHRQRGRRIRNTSACAEKSHYCAAGTNQHWKYLRVRGEEAPCLISPVL